MKTSSPSSPTRDAAVVPAVVVALLIAVCGCDAPTAHFQLNKVYLRKQEFEVDQQFSGGQAVDLKEVLVTLFGTPDDPHVPVVSGAETTQLLDVKKLRMAAGRVGSDEQGRPFGLYREHCAHCHGISGDAGGPTAPFLNPYPRDYRLGVFKFKSTPKGKKPTHDDLRLLLLNGIPDTAMPSFKLLAEDELEALIQYVQYLSIRGEVERNLILELADMDAGQLLSTPEMTSTVQDIVAGVVESWVSAEEEATEIPPRPDELSWEESVEIGRRLFYGEVANCVKCHGDSALGDGQTNDYDDWTKDFLNPNDPQSVARIPEFEAYGALKPRNIEPRNLRREAFRGGHRPIDIFRRINNGIDGTPMPAAVRKSPAVPLGLTDDQVWHLVDYVRNLRYEALSQPHVLKELQRERQ